MDHGAPEWMPFQGRTLWEAFRGGRGALQTGIEEAKSQRLERNGKILEDLYYLCKFAHEVPLHGHNHECFKIKGKQLLTVPELLLHSGYHQ